MADIHQLILTSGVQRAKELAEDKPARQRIEAASRVMADEEYRIGITHAGFAMTSLPHRSVAARVWIREAPGLKLLVESGHDGDGKPVGLPYGSVARLILLYLQTQAIRTDSCEVELGRSMHEWLNAMGIDPGGTRACPQLSQMTLAARWMAPRKCTARLSYRVAIARNCFSLAKKFSIRWRAL
jgi:hypothetical protein